MLPFLVVLAVVLIAAVALCSGARGLLRRGDRFTLSQTTRIVSSVDATPYQVHLRHANPDLAADALAEINRRITRLLRELRRKYLRGRVGQGHGGRAAATRRLLALYNPDNLAENSPRDPEGDTSYTVDKGAILALCLRERERHGGGDHSPHNLHNLNTVMFVVVHELTHIAVEVLDHPRQFWEAFKFLLRDAANIGILLPVPYGRFPERYCGITIDYNPFYDAQLDALR